MTVLEIFGLYRQHLAALYDAAEVESLTLMVATEVTGLSKAQIKAFPERELTAEQSSRLQDVLLKLETGEPVQYILGETEFCGLTFKVNPSVLIPRPETEELVEWVLGEVKGLKSKAQSQHKDNLANLHILDIGTGSGCIAVSLKSRLQDAAVSALDISAGALDTAQENAALNNVQVNFIQDDVLNLRSGIRHSTFDIIISNPPYVTLHDKTQMHRNVTNFEPHTALFVPEDDPLIFYKAIAGFALTNLQPQGLLFFEINESLGNETVEMLQAKGFINVKLRQDLNGRDRMVKAAR